MRRIVSFTIVLSLFLCIFSCYGYAIEGSGLNQYMCGDNVSASIENGVLTISGTGKMYDYLEVYGDGNYEVDGYGITGHGKDGDGEYYYRDIPWPTERPSTDSQSGDDVDYDDCIHKVIVEEGITYLGANAFHDMKYLMDISLPSTLVKIGTGCFYGCGKLKEITIPASVTELGEKDTANRFAMFEYCGGLEKVIIPENSRLKYIESGAFYSAGNFDGLEVYIPEQVEEIG